MNDLALDTDDDLKIFGGDLALKSGGESLAQRVLIALSINLGEWFLDVREGVPWLSEVFVRNPDITLIDNTIRARIMSVPGVSRIAEYRSTYTPATRVFVFSFRAEMATGEDGAGTIAINGGD